MCDALTTNNKIDNRRDASVLTKKLNKKVSENTAYMSHAKEEPNAVKGLLVDCKNLDIENVMNIKRYNDFLKGSAPDTVHPALWEHAKLNMNVGLYRVNNIEAYKEKDALAKKSGEKFEANAGDVFQVRGYDLANMTLVRSDNGWIILDILTTTETAAAAYKFVQDNLECDGHLVKGLVYSHSHIDHYGGASGIVTDGDADFNPEIFAPEGFLKHAVSENIYVGNAMTSRAEYMYGSALRRDCKGQIDSGLGKSTAVGTNSIIAPTKEISIPKDGGFVEETIDGTRLWFQLTPGTEAPVEMNIYMPDTNVLFIAENCTGTLHNFYTLRGAEVRDGEAWADYLDETATLFPKTKIICSSHNWPHFGVESCREYIALQRDVYRYLNSTALNLINKGYTIEEIGRVMEKNIPDTIKNEWCSHGFYGSFNHNAKAVYQRYIGWYDGNPANLNKMLPEDSASRYIECMGGAAKTLKFARKAYALGEYAWAAELLNKVIFARLNIRDEIYRNQAKLMCANALEQMGYQSESASWRNEYLTGALALRNGLNLPRIDYSVTDTTVNSMSMEMITKYIGIMFNGMAAQSFTFSMESAFTGIEGEVAEEGYIWARNGVLNFRVKRDGGEPPVSPLDLAIKCKKIDFFNAFARGEKECFDKLVVVRGNIDKAKELLEYIEPFKTNFPIVTPKCGTNEDISKLISQCADMLEGYHENMVKMGDRITESCKFKLADMDDWTKIYYPKLVKTGIIEDGGFFKEGAAPYSGIGKDGLFNKTEYVHFLYRCYKKLAEESFISQDGSMALACIDMLEPYVEKFRGQSYKAHGNGLKLNYGDYIDWKNIYYKELIYPYGEDKISDDLFFFPDKSRRDWGIGYDGKFVLCEICNVLAQLYQVVLGIKKKRSELCD